LLLPPGGTAEPYMEEGDSGHGHPLP
jgi:hypothetical protein